MGRESVLLAVLATLFIVLFVIIPMNVPRKDYELNELPPNPAHPLGTDDLGRDVLQLSEKGTIESVESAALVSFISGIVGIIAAYVATFKERIRFITQIFSSITLSFPPVFIMMLILGLLVEKIELRRISFAILATSMVWNVFYNNLYRRFTLIENSNFVKAAIAFGRGRNALFFFHFVPNSIEVITESFFSVFSLVVSLEATLGFIGIGIPNSLGELIRIQMLRSINYVGFPEFSLSLLSPFVPILGRYSYHVAGVLGWHGINLWSFLAPFGNLITLLGFVKLLSILSVKTITSKYKR